MNGDGKVRVAMSVEECDAYFEALTTAQGTLRGRRATVAAADQLEKLAGRIESARVMKVEHGVDL